MEFESWVALPLLSGDEGNLCYIWNSFEVKKTHKGLGVFATVDMEITYPPAVQLSQDCYVFFRHGGILSPFNLFFSMGTK